MACLGARPALAGEEGRRNTAIVLGAVGAYELLRGHAATGVLAGAGAVTAYKRYRDYGDDAPVYRERSRARNRAVRVERYRDVYRARDTYRRDDRRGRRYESGRYRRDDGSYRADRDDLNDRVIRDDRVRDPIGDRPTQGGKGSLDRYDGGYSQGGYSQGGYSQQGGASQGGYSQQSGASQGGYTQQGGSSQGGFGKGSYSKGEARRSRRN
jgi:hypothetical protein